ncbi:MAG: membrane protein insertase YidC [Candidatus Omnitrophota bacterium]
MEKRLILAIALSLLVLLTWSMLAPKPYHVVSEGVTAKEAVSIPALPKQSARSLTASQEQALPPASLFKYTQDKFEVIFIEPLAAIKEVNFKTHQDYKFSLKNGFILDDQALSFKIAKTAPDSLTFVHNDQNKKITKKYTFSNSNYSILLEITIQNVSSASITLNAPLVLGTLNFASNSIQSRYQDVVIATKDKTRHYNARKNLEFSDTKFLGLRDQYFCALVEPESDSSLGFIKKINSQESEIGLVPQETVIAPGQQIMKKFRIYLGPQDLGLINSVKSDWSAVVNYGTFDFIAQILLQLLFFFYRIVHNWGWAIVILSVAVYILLFPLTLKQMRSMKEMQLLQPLIEEIRKNYKDNQPKQNQLIMELYRKHKINPLGGCLPLILQMPIFFALYQALMRCVVLKGAHFLWIKDLSEPDRLFTLPTSLPVLGNEINILPIVMTIGMFIQQKMSMSNTNSKAAEQQKLMLIIMPLMFGLIFYHMPSGLVLYWFINSALMLAYQFRINRIR